MKYQVKDPEGQLHIIDGPEGATPEEVIAQAQKLVPQKQPSLGTAYKIAQELPFPTAISGGIPQQLSDISGEKIAEKGGQMGYPKIGAGLGTLASMFPALLGAGTSFPEKNVSGVLARPQIPPERMASVEAARSAGVPLSRAEQTGGKFMTGMENLLEKTPLGSRPIEKMRNVGNEAMQAWRERFGPAPEAWEAGKTAQKGMAGREASMNALKNEMFEKIPENVHIPLNESQKIADQIIQEQSQYLPTTRNADVSNMARDIQSARTGISSGEGVTGGPEVRGITTQTPDKLIPPSQRTIPSSLVGEAGKPLSFTENIPGRTIKGGPQYGVQQGFGPETKFEQKSNYQLLKRLRETLGGKAAAARAAGHYSEERDFLRLKSGVDKDIEKYVVSQKTPLGSMVGKEFASRYQQANAFSGAYKQLFKGEEALNFADMPPEKVLGKVFQKNNETAIKQFHAMVGDDAFKTAKQKFVSDLLSGNNVKGELAKYSPGTLRSIFSQPELADIEKFGGVQSLRKSVPSMQGTQGSARSNVHAGSYGGLGMGILDALRGDLPGAAIGIGQYVIPDPLARLYTATSEGVPYNLPMDKLIRAALTASRKKNENSITQ